MKTEQSGFSMGLYKSIIPANTAKIKHHYASAVNRQIFSLDDLAKKIVQFFLCLTIFFGYDMANASSNPANFDLNTIGKLGSSTNYTFPNLNNNFLLSQTNSLTPSWTEQGGNTYYGRGTAQSNGVSIDSSGNTYIVGQTSVGINGQQQTGSNDYFITKYSPSGTLIWAKQVGGKDIYLYPADTRAMGVSTDTYGNVYVVGWTTGGINGQAQNGQVDYFIAQYSESGNLKWAKQVGVGYYGNTTYATGVSTDSAANVYVTGYTNVGISGQKQTGKTDYFIAKYDRFGNMRGTRQAGAAGGNTYATGVSTDSAANIYVTGYTDAGIFGQKQTGKTDYFIVKYNPAGNQVWTKQVGSSGGITEANGISLDIHSNIYIAGFTNAGISGQTQNGLNDYFIAQYDFSGNLKWTKQVGSSGGNTVAYGISADKFDSVGIYVVGGTNKGISGQEQTGYEDYFITRYDIEGNQNWIKQIGAPTGLTQANGVGTDNTGNIHVAGYTTKGISGQSQIGYQDYFVTKHDQSGDLSGAEEVGGVIDTQTYGSGMSLDSNGNTFVVGSTSTTLFGQPQTGYNDYFIAKYDQSGSRVWVKQVGIPDGHTYAKGVSADSYGNIYVVGWTDSGLKGQKQTGIWDYFIAKYDQSGNLTWMKQVGAVGGDTKAFGASTDSTGNIYVVGYTTKGISGQSQNGVQDYFIAQYNQSGNLLWTRQVGGTSSLGSEGTKAYGVATDIFGYVYIVGYTAGPIFGQWQNGKHDYFIARYDVSGNLKWGHQVGDGTTGWNTTDAYSVNADSQGNVYVVGYTTGSISGQIKQGYQDYFIAEYDRSGSLIWTRQVGTSHGTTRATGVSTSSNGNVYIAGFTDKGISGQKQTGLYDYFVTQYDEFGNLYWTAQVGASRGDTGAFGINADSLGNLYIAGSTNRGISGQTQIGSVDYFVTKWIN